MKLTIQEINLLPRYGCFAEDARQIEKASKLTKFYIDTGRESAVNREITEEEAENLLTRENFVSGLCRSTFHQTSMRPFYGISNDVIGYVRFDSSEYSKEFLTEIAMELL